MDDPKSAGTPAPAASTHRDPPHASRAGTVVLGGETPVHRMGFGAMRVTGDGVWGPPDDPERARRVLARVPELGIQLVDTADSYGPEVSENLLREVLHPYPDDMVVATKGGFVRPGPDQWEPDGRPEHLREALHGSLRRLDVDTVDLYQLHRPDPDVPLAESVGALDDLRREGKIRHLGLSNVDVDQLATARAEAPIASVQNRYNLTDREADPVVDACHETGMAFLPWFPLQTGELAEPGGVVRKVAERHGATPAQIALAWLLARSPVVAPIPGTSRVSHLEENVAAASLSLGDDDLDRLDAVADPAS
jgi:aryl-alcohol dehydrogenase-like predicted oxidoreductase